MPTGRPAPAINLEERRRRPLRLAEQAPLPAFLAIADGDTEGDWREKTDGFRVLELADLLGSVPDELLAEVAGVHKRTVAIWRHMIGIKPFRSPDQVGTARKNDGRRLRYSQSKLTPFHDLMGTVPDAEIAQRANATTEGVKAYRARHHIPAHTAEPAVKTPRRRRVLRRPLDAHHAIIGVLLDARVAKIAQVSPEAVGLYRLRHGIEEGTLSKVPGRGARGK